MISSKEVLKTLNHDLLYLEWHCNDSETRVVENCIKHVGYLEKIISELIGETVDLNKALKLMDETHEMTLSRLTTVSRISTARGKQKRA